MVPNTKNECLKWNLISRLIGICKIQSCCPLFLFWTGNTSLGHIWSKKIKIVSLYWNLNLNNSNMKISMVMFFNFFFEQKYSFFSKFVSKNQYCLLKLKRRIKTTSNMESGWWLLFFSFVDQKYPFWVNLVQKSKINSLSGNLE